MDLQDKKISFFTVLCSEFIDYAGISLVYPLFAYMLFEPSLQFLPPEASESTRGMWLGILISLHPLLQFFCAPIFGSLSDRIGRKKILQVTMALGLVGYGLACAACIFQSLILLALFRVFVGIGAGNCSVVSAIVADLSDSDKKARNYGLLNMAFGAGFTLGPFLSGILASKVHLAAPFFAAFVFVALNWILVSWKLVETRPSQPRERISFFTSFTQIKQAALMKELRFIFLALLVFSFGWSFFTEFISVFLIDKYQFTPAKIGIYYAYTGFFYSFSAGFLIYPFIRQFKVEKVLFLAMLLSGLYLFLFALINQTPMLWLYLPLSQFFLSFVYPAICAVISNRVSLDRQGEVMGIYQAVIALALAITPICCGSFVGRAPILVIIVSGCLMVGAALINGFLKDRVPALDPD